MSPRPASQWLARYRFGTGRFTPPSGKSVLIVTGATPSTAAQAFAAQTAQRFPRENLFFVSPTAAAGSTDGNSPIPPPFPLWGGQRYLRRLHVAFILIDQGVTVPGYLAKLARDADITIVAADQWHTENRQEATFAALEFEVGRVREPIQGLKKRLKFFFWQHLVLRLAPRGVRRLSGLTELRRELGAAEHILCLGNGPSSEDISDEEQAFDAVFRVNDRWLSRGHFTRARVVFTGAAECLENIGAGPIYGFLNDTRSLPIVRKLRGQLNPLPFFTATDMGFPLTQFEQHKPTNGVLMLYLAVKLQPERLTVAGIDLYQDPRGCYPDDSTTPNDYTSVHNPAREVDTILSLLLEYEGKLTIIGDRLAEAYEHRRNSQTQ